MWKGLLVICLLLSVARCGKPTPTISGVDLPPSNDPIELPEPGNISNNNSTVQVDADVKTLEAPLVLLRGEIPQFATSMNASPGA